jgi:DDE superfamily endonuclease
MQNSTLSAYRTDLYESCSRAADALMNLNDALLTDTAAQSFVELTLSPFFVREWSSAYAACKDGTLDRAALRDVRVKYAPMPVPSKRLVVAGDASSIARPASGTARDRTYVHASHLPEGSKPVRPGWQFSFVAVVPEDSSRWVYTLDVERIQSHKTSVEVMGEQLIRLVALLAQRFLFLGDGGYGNVAFLLKTQTVACDKLLRLAKNRVLYRTKPPRPAKPGPGRPKEDGAVFRCQDPTTHASWEGVDAHGHRLQVEGWEGLHFQEARSIEVSVIRVTRHAAADTKRDPKVSWFLFCGQECLALAQIPPPYARRYRIEHGFRFKKQDLMWEAVRLRTPERFELWTDLVCCAENQWYLARESGLAHPQPWESAHRPLTPQQVRRGMNRMLAELGTPARLCRVRGNSPGRLPGAIIEKAKRYPTVFKSKNDPEKIERIV